MASECEWDNVLSLSNRICHNLHVKGLYIPLLGCSISIPSCILSHLMPLHFKQLYKRLHRYSI